MKNEILNYSTTTTIKKDDNENKEELIINLSMREKEIFDLIQLGKSNKEIALSVNISINTVKFHIKNIYDKLNIKSRQEAYNLPLE